MINNVKCSYANDNWLTHNAITYRAWDVVARLLGGYTVYTPNYIGFVYGTEVNPSIVTEGDQSVRYADILSTVSSYGNIQFSRITSDPTFGTTDSTLYDSNILQLSAKTSDNSELAIPDGLSLDSGHYIYLALFLTRIIETSGMETILLAHTNLKKPTDVYATKVDGIDFGISWNLVLTPEEDT